MEKFRRGDTLDVELVIRHDVGIRDGYLVFVHEDDVNTHIFWGFQGAEGRDKPLPASERTTLKWIPTIDEDQKIGVYALDKVNFKTFDGSTLDAPIPRHTLRFEVVEAFEVDTQVLEDPPVLMQELEAPIVVEKLSISSAKE